MTDKNKKREFACNECNEMFVTYPPDDMYTSCFMTKHCEKSLERFIECDNCNHKNERFWCYHDGEVLCGPIGNDVGQTVEQEFSDAFPRSKSSY